MGLDLLMDRGTPNRAVSGSPGRSSYKPPISKLDAERVFTRVRVILMNGLEADASRFMHATAAAVPGAASARSR